MIASPCINICRMEDGLCAGCFRTLSEIAVWSDTDDEQRRVIIAASTQRRARHDCNAELISRCHD